MSESAPFDGLENPYASPQTAPERTGLSTSGDALEQELRAFVGPRADVYLRKWAPLLYGSGQAGFNWPAFLLAGIWLPYRKMYAVSLIFYGAIVAESVLEEVVFAGILRQ